MADKKKKTSKKKKKATPKTSPPQGWGLHADAETLDEADAKAPETTPLEPAGPLVYNVDEIHPDDLLALLADGWKKTAEAQTEPTLKKLAARVAKGLNKALRAVKAFNEL